MPYISDEERYRLDLLVDALAKEVYTGGQFNYVVTKLALSQLDGTINYAALSQVLGDLEACKLEFYRRAVVPYEETKIEDNGDVYG
jgi:hypothetical protein